MSGFLRGSGTGVPRGRDFLAEAYSSVMLRSFRAGGVAQVGVRHAKHQVAVHGDRFSEFRLEHDPSFLLCRMHVV